MWRKSGASYGIGFAIAKAYAKAGATIVFNDIKQELVDKGLAGVVEQAIFYMKENCHNSDLTMNALAEYLGVSSVTLSVEVTIQDTP